MSYGQGGPQSQWDPWKPQSQQPWNSGSDDGTPDWAALAEASESRNKRRKLLFIAGGALATIAIGTAVAMAVVSANGGDPEAGPSNLPASASLPGSATATPSFAPTSAPPPLDPKDFISSAKKDTAPLSPDTLFPDKQLPVDGTVYKKGPTADTTSCATAAGGTLPKILTANGCTRLMRTTYTDGGIAVTVGVAVFDTAAQATKAKAQTDDRSIVRSLFGKGVKPFCDGAFCRSTRNAYGRYAYFTISGFTSGKDVTTKDTKVFRAGNDLAQFAANQIHRRGQTQASAAANQ
ncbi:MULTISPECIES: hypothetical protein [Streptomyces]|uniref:Tat pathway signal protein n=2 Tax=Streptomyces TaxID=1883 RepID=A0ABS9JB88_9ACTN|nr:MULTISPECIES: hypothetical protein [Streptomyces]MCG0062812.1 hypothetical protein [Streptomyces tricolor]MYU29461.1 hypothetical protein [Streptomyces sp. SID7810]OYP15870.1 hypothetical protein CFC35_16300 [Streptomyces sp. FBKL.4005]BCM68879.1 hypothetical protein EASAB2608_04213 [Streptomyces sp. EAS-AB2608]